MKTPKNNILFEPLSQRLKDLNQSHHLRKLEAVDGIDFSSNDFLNLSQHTSLIKAAQDATAQEGVGSGASRLVTAEHSYFTQAEKQLAHFSDKETALLFSTGYMANIGLIAALAQVGATFFIDRLCHASIYDGLTLGKANYRRYKHCDMQSLETKLCASDASLKIICTESIFSMDGDAAPLAHIVDLAQKYNALTLVDEAHALGMYGHNGAGLAQELKLSNDIDISVGTLGKAVGCAGGFVAGPQDLRDILINHARSFIYSTAPTPAMVASSMAGITLLPHLRVQATEVLQKAQHLRNLLTVTTANSTSHIVPIFIGDEQATLAIAQKIYDAGFVVKAIRPPTVAPGTARLRIVMHLHNSYDEINSLAACINKELKAYRHHDRIKTT